MSKPDVLAVAKLHPFYHQALSSLYTVHDRTHITDPAAFADLAPRIVGVAGTGEASVPRSLLSQLPNAKVVSDPWRLRNVPRKIDETGATRTIHVFHRNKIYISVHRGDGLSPSWAIAG